jgi:hypothetical protein
MRSGSKVSALQPESGDAAIRINFERLSRRPVSTKFALLQLADEAIKQGCRLPLSARMRHADEPYECSLIEVDRKGSAAGRNGAFDPELTSWGIHPTQPTIDGHR